VNKKGKGKTMNPLLGGGLLAASMLLGQTQPAAPTPLIIQQAPVQVVPQPAPARPGFGWFSREDRPIITKIQTWFKRDSQSSTQQPPFLQPASNSKLRETAPPPLVAPSRPVEPTTPADFPRKLPSTGTPTPGKTVQQTNLQQAAEATNVKSPILKQLAEKIGRDEKFEWITGQLEIENGTPVLYYSTPETVDKYNGRIVLMPQKVDMKSFRRGDLLSVRGQLAQRSALQGATPVYRLTDANLIERPKQ
jgi:hypothetical protein